MRLAVLTLTELRRAARALDQRLRGTRLQRVIQRDEFRLALLFHGAAGDPWILLSCSPEFARISALASVPQAPRIPPSFAEYIRAHLLRAFYDAMEVAPDDRQVRIALRGSEGTFTLLLSILGTRSNVYLLDPAGRLVHAMRALADTRRELAFGSIWANPAERLRAEGGDRWSDVSDAEYLEAVEFVCERMENRRQAEVLAHRIASALDKDLDSLSRKMANLTRDLAEIGRAEEYKQKGELLKCILHQIKTGDTEIVTTDFASGEQVSIALDPGLTPAENLDVYFMRYQKISRGGPVLQRQLEETRSILQSVAPLREELRRLQSQDPPNPAALAALAQQPRIRRLLARQNQAPKPDRKPMVASARQGVPARLIPKKFLTEDGLEIWVGRNDEGNDYLTTRLARGNDLFFHLDGYPGSHVILRTAGRSDPPGDSMLAACELAVHFSQLKNASRADVHVAAIKDIKKPKGAKAGLVFVRGGKTIHLKRDSKRLQAILASRLDT